MNPKEIVRVSKMLSLVLRHKPETIGIKLDSNGWTDVDSLIMRMNAKGFKLDFETLCYVVDNNNKKRFAFNNDKTKIRASQGHSVNVDLGYTPQVPPPVLYHGTGVQFLDAILKDGLLKMNRHHVHLSADVATAQNVGQRKGKPVILIVDASEMHQQGFEFFISENNVWLTERVPAEYIRLQEVKK